LNYILFYSGNVPKYVNFSIDSIIKAENSSDNIYFCTDQKPFRSDIEFIHINEINSKLISEFNKLDYFKNEINPLWKTSLSRIFYLFEASTYLNIFNFIHFDCDVLVYKSFQELKNNFITGKINITPLNELFLNFSYSYFDNKRHFENLCNNILKILSNSNIYEKKYYEGRRLNEMVLMNISYINNPNEFNLLDVLPNYKTDIIFDPGSYGQYIGGTHNKRFSKKFINEDHYVGRNIIRKDYKIQFKNKKPTVFHNGKLYNLANLHMHSKNLKNYV